MIMFCPKCGAQNPDDAKICQSCQEPLPILSGRNAVERPPEPPRDQPSFAQQQDPSPYQSAYQNPYQQPGYEPIPPRPSNFLAGNIIVAIVSACTCVGLITGIIGIVFSAMVNSKYAAGDYAGAKSSSTVAKVMFFVTLGLAIIGLIYWIISFAMGMALLNDSGFMQYYDQIFDQIYDMY
jgi:hypothetical protein